MEFAAWVGVRLPTEAEWEYAARGEGQDIIYPWGDEAPDCTRADWDDMDDDIGCNGLVGTSPVCSYPAGNSEQGLCDLAGNLAEWVLDEYVGNYEDAPIDGSARCRSADCEGNVRRVYRGGSWTSVAANLRAARRFDFDPSRGGRGLGARLARATPP